MVIHYVCLFVCLLNAAQRDSFSPSGPKISVRWVTSFRHSVTLSPSDSIFFTRPTTGWHCHPVVGLVKKMLCDRPWQRFMEQ